MRRHHPLQPLHLYRIGIWLPLVVPIAVILGMNVWLKGLGLPKPSGSVDVVLEMLGWSGILGGPVYLLLATWASEWIRGRAESTVRRLMFIAPLLMVAAFSVISLAMGLATSHVTQWLGVAALGAGVAIPVGYGYVGLTVALRHWLGPQERMPAL